ncbi:hypothetical protein OROMI_002883 [Orobanche minor]
MSQPAVSEKKNKNLRKAHKPKHTEVSATPVEAQVEEIAEVAQPTAPNLQGATPAEEVVTAITADPEPMAAMMDDQLLAKVEGTCKSTAFPKSVIPSPVRASTPVQEPSPHREPTPVRDPSPHREPTLLGSLLRNSLPYLSPNPNRQRNPFLFGVPPQLN